MVHIFQFCRVEPRRAAFVDEYSSLQVHTLYQLSSHRLRICPGRMADTPAGSSSGWVYSQHPSCTSFCVCRAYTAYVGNRIRVDSLHPSSIWALKYTFHHGRKLPQKYQGNPHPCNILLSCLHENWVNLRFWIWSNKSKVLVLFTFKKIKYQDS